MLFEIQHHVKTIHLCKYTLVASLTSFVGAFVLILLSSFIFNFDDSVTYKNRDIQLNILDIGGYTLIAPLLETYLLIFIAKHLISTKRTIHLYSLLIGIVFAFLHSIIVPISFLGILLSFYIYAYSYFHWREKSSFFVSFSMCLLPHIFTNTLVLISLDIVS